MALPYGRYFFGARQLAQLGDKHTQLLTWLSYLDSLSLGKTSDFQNAIDSMVNLVRDCRNICNSAKRL